LASVVDVLWAKSRLRLAALRCIWSIARRVFFWRFDPFVCFDFRRSKASSLDLSVGLHIFRSKTSPQLVINAISTPRSTPTGSNPFGSTAKTSDCSRQNEMCHSPYRYVNVALLIRPTSERDQRNLSQPILANFTSPQ